MLSALIIFILTLVMVIWQPRGLGIGWSALGGAALALVTGVIQLSDIPVVWHIIWDATFTFVGLIIISLILDEAGFFHWAALHVARWGGGHGRLLFPLIVLLGAVISAFFANDGAALILTPIVLSMLLALGFGPAAAMAFVMACGFVADTTSLPLVISNLVNIVSAGYFQIPFDRYAAVMVPVDLVALAATLLVLYAYFRRDIPLRYDLSKLDTPASAIKDPLVFRWTFPTLAALLIAYFVTAAYAVPVSVVTGLAALLMLALAGRWWRGGQGARINVRGVIRHAPWQIVLFSLGMYLVVYGLRNAGLTAYLAQVLEAIGQHGVLAAALGTGLISAGLSAVMNNMPTVLIGALGIHHAQGLSAPVREAMIYANVIGCDLGPKFTPIGSLATLLWLHVLERKGTRITWGYYFRVGLVLTTPVLLLTLLALAARLMPG
ncbi:arsenic transporter [Metallibacterium scheffleri]|uniref:Arsenical pump membrane protein n=1 Tax=Metallibacterium scheffleri TaxID=993689 RepID=A0A4S3KR07_9GAMM|nr:arsenic transporter [Metallibacterium scheffleri]THD11505.1 arsenical efflux pump membrane protein ArsB [Metallibacterium scheffleri]